MKPLRDVICPKCHFEKRDYYEHEKYGKCPKCGTKMKQAFKKANVNTEFPGSHNWEYSKHGRREQ